MLPFKKCISLLTSILLFLTPVTVSSNYFLAPPRLPAINMGKTFPVSELDTLINDLKVREIKFSRVDFYRKIPELCAQYDIYEILYIIITLRNREVLDYFSLFWKVLYENNDKQLRKPMEDLSIQIRDFLRDGRTQYSNVPEPLKAAIHDIVNPEIHGSYVHEAQKMFIHIMQWLIGLERTDILPLAAEVSDILLSRNDVSGYEFAGAILKLKDNRFNSFANTMLGDIIECICDPNRQIIDNRFDSAKEKVIIRDMIPTIARMSPGEQNMQFWSYLIEKGYYDEAVILAMNYIKDKNNFYAAYICDKLIMIGQPLYAEKIIVLLWDARVLSLFAENIEAFHKKGFTITSKAGRRVVQAYRDMSDFMHKYSKEVDKAL